MDINEKKFFKFLYEDTFGKYEGDFSFTPFLSYKKYKKQEKIEKEIIEDGIERKYLESVQIWMATRIEDAPEWWNNSHYGDDLEFHIVEALYNQMAKIANEYKESLAKG